MPSFVPSRYCIRTSGRRTFRRCPRKWSFQASLKRNLQSKGSEQNIHFWFGTAIHFAMEDFFGYNKFGDPREAFKAYYEAFDEDELPSMAEEHYTLGLNMLNYFLDWYPKHNSRYGFETLWLDEKNKIVPPNTEGARPCVEEAFMLELPKKVWVREDTGEIICDNTDEVKMKYHWAKDNTGKDRPYIIDTNACFVVGGKTKVFLREQPMYYHGTIDRVCIDPQGRLWLLDYKTAKGADTNKLDTDDQISAYMWAAEQWFHMPIHGFIYLQMTKDTVQSPRRLKNGELSVDKKQKTTLNLIRQEVMKDYGSIAEAPEKYIKLINHFAELESDAGDKFIRWDMVTRNREQKISTFQHIMAELELMCNPFFKPFPSPTRDCIWDCSFREACLMMDKGESKQAEKWLVENFEERPHEENGEVDAWRKDIKWPEKPYELPKDFDFSSESLKEDGNIINIILPEEYK